MGPAQTARHTRGLVSAHELGYVNRRHVSTRKLEAAITDVVNAYSKLDLPKVWGTGETAAADGTKIDLYENNLISEYHIRYGGYGGIAYHHVSDTYVALFTHFIDGLLKNASEIRPKAVASDTQGQSAPVFGLAHLLGIGLMPRIRNWKGLTLFRPDKVGHRGFRIRRPPPSSTTRYAARTPRRRWHPSGTETSSVKRKVAEYSRPAALIVSINYVNIVTIGRRS